MQLNAPPIIMDEVQYVPELFRSIKIACDASQQRGLFMLSGSQPLLLMKNASESLSGSVGESVCTGDAGALPSGDSE